MLEQAQQITEQLRAWRRHLHAHPELSGKEEQTARFVAAELRKLGYEPVENVGGTFGLTATLKVNDQPAVALRADMDALPIQEDTGLEFSSKNPGVMHACGHDAHTAMLLGAAKLLRAQKDRLARSVKLIFQPAEEQYPGGAAPMIAGGALRDVEQIFGIHIISTLPTGQLGTRVGPFMAAVNRLDIKIFGKGGHAAMPEQCVDPVVTAAQIILALQTVVSRSIAMTDTAVVSVTQVNAGTADNVIPPEAALAGTIRTFDEEVREKVCRRVRELAETIAQANGARAEVSLNPGYPALVNHAPPTERAWQAARKIGFNAEQLRELPAQGGGEDFAYYLREIPGTFVFLGAGDLKNYPHHHPRFQIDENMLPWGAALLAQYAMEA